MSDMPESEPRPKRSVHVQNAHTHFCYRCFGGTSKGQGSPSGWWRCTKAPCLRGQEERCLTHRAELQWKAAEVSR